MIKIILIIVYISSVAVARDLNKRLVRLDKYYPITPLMWVIPIVNIVLITVLLTTILEEKLKRTKINWTNKYVKWFLGKDWI